MSSPAHRIVVLTGLVAILLPGCPGPGPAGSDAGLDASPGADGGGDAGNSGATLTLFDYPAIARGPVRVEVVVQSDAAIELALEQDGAGTFAPATLFDAASDIPTPAPTGGSIALTWIWDSVSDVPVDASVRLRVVDLSAGGVPLGMPFKIMIRNDPEGDRTVLAAHPLATLPGGGASNVGTTVSVLSLAPAGDTGVDVTVGEGPDGVFFAPSAAVAFVRNGGDGTLSTVDIAGPSVTVRPTVIDLAPAAVFDVSVAPDGQALFLVAGGGAINDLVELSLATGDPMETRRASLSSVAQCVAVSPRGDWIAVDRHDPAGDHLVEIFDRRTLAVMGSLPYTGFLCETMRWSWDGRFLAITEGFIGTTLTLVDVTDATTPVVTDTVGGLNAPMDVAFHPDGTALLLSELGANQLVPYAISPAGTLTAGTPVSGGLPQAAEMDIVLRGSRAGLVLVSALSAVGLIQLDPTGTATSVGSIDTGDGIDFGVQGVAIAP